ncbi:MAG TPA: metallophosphoesterase family protein [Bacillota bacterium]
MNQNKSVRVGVISDTHIPRRAKALPGWVREAFEGVDLILHAGDLTTLGVLDDLAELAPVEAVAGNVDAMGPAALALPSRRVVEVGGVRIGLTHGHDGPGSSTPERALAAFREEGVAAVVFGHSHQPMNEVVDGVLLFNPGSATDPRWAGEPTVGLLTVHGSAEPRVAGRLVHRSLAG